MSRPDDAADVPTRGLPAARRDDPVNPDTLRIDPSNHRLRRVGRLARRRLRIDGAGLANGTYTDGHLSVEISGLGGADGDGPARFEWRSDRPVALVIVRSGTDGDDVSFHVGPIDAGTVVGAGPEGGHSISYFAVAYDIDPEQSATGPASSTAPATTLLARLLRSASPA
jgi:hypothetical protein